MVVPSWQEIIDDIIEVLTLKHPALKDVSAISTVSLNKTSHKTAHKTALGLSQQETKEDMSDDLLDALIVHKFKCGHVIKVPKHMYQSVVRDELSVCHECLYRL